MTDASDDISTIIENDVDYRKRLLTTDWARHIEGRELMIEPPIGSRSGRARRGSSHATYAHAYMFDANEKANHMTMNTFQQRVISEKAELDSKIGRLAEFLTGEMFRTLPEDEQRRLKDQHAVMNAYSEILLSRIEAFREI